jgi:protein SCO1
MPDHRNVVRRNVVRRNVVRGHVVRRMLARGASLLAALLVCLLQLRAAPALAQTIVEDGVVTRKEAAPKRLSGIDILEHLDQPLPLDLEFTDTADRRVTLKDYVRGERPVIFTLNYADCPMLCSLQLAGLSRVLGKLDRNLGRDFDIVTVSLNPEEKTERTRETEERYRADYPRAEGRGGWHFVRGTQHNIDALADALGVRYGYNEKRKEYVHPAALIISTPSGRISRYLYGIEYHPKTLSLSLVEAAEGKIGSSVDRFILYCFHYDDTEGRYAPVAMNIMRVGGSLTALALGGFLGSYWLRHSRKRSRLDGLPLVGSGLGAGEIEANLLPGEAARGATPPGDARS